LDALSELIFVEWTPERRFNGQYYRDVLLQKNFCQCQQYDVFLGTCSLSNKTAHGARDMIELLHRSTPDFIAPDMWPPNSPKLNPVDYAVWSIMQQHVYQTRVHDIENSFRGGSRNLRKGGRNIPLPLSSHLFPSSPFPSPLPFPPLPFPLPSPSP